MKFFYKFLILLLLKSSQINSIPSIVIVNNKPMTKNTHGDLIEFSFDIQNDGRSTARDKNSENQSLNVKIKEIVEKSNILSDHKRKFGGFEVGGDKMSTKTKGNSIKIVNNKIIDNLREKDVVNKSKNVTNATILTWKIQNSPFSDKNRKFPLNSSNKINSLMDLKKSDNAVRRKDILEKSNIFKNSDFVTKSHFHNGLITKKNFTKKEPVKNSKFSLDLSNQSPLYSSFTKFPSSLNKKPEYLQTTLIFDDNFSSLENSLKDDVFKDFTTNSPPPESLNQRPPPLVFFSTPSPTTVIPIIIKPNDKKKRKKSKPKVPTTPPTNVNEHIIKNLDYYKQLLAVNCTKEKNALSVETIEVTPKPSVNHKDIYDFETKKDEKKKDKKKCDCKKHHHHHHHKKSHEKHSEEHKPYASYYPQPTHQPAVYVQTLAPPKPEFQTHYHEHQQKLVKPTYAPFFGSTGLPPLGDDYEEVGNMFETFYRAIEGAFTTTKDVNGHQEHEEEEEEVDYESRDESISEYTEEEEDDEEVSDESEYHDEEEEDERRRKKREIQKDKKSKRSHLGMFSSLNNKILSLFNYSNTTRSKRESNLESKIMSSNNSSSSARVMPYDFLGMISQIITTGRTEQNTNFLVESNQLKRKKYNNYQLWRILTSTSDEISLLDDFRMSVEGSKVHWLKHGKVSDIVIPPPYLDSFREFLKESNLKYGVKLRNIQHAIRYENLKINRRQQIESEIINGHPLTFHRYHPSRDIYAYYGFIKRTYPTFVELIHLGFSFESKPITIVKISNPTKKQRKKPAIFILAGVSSHYWLPIASSLYIVDTLVKNIANNDTLGATIRKFDWYILNLLNVDGYDYSIAYDRLWMKTRSLNLRSDDGILSSAFSWFRSTQNETCVGVDASRNFDYKWKKDDYDSGGNRCSDFYEGSAARSESEVKLLSNFLLKNNKTIKLFLNLDGFGSQISFPSTSLKASSIEILNDVCKAGLKNVRSHRGRENRFLVRKDTILTTPEAFAMHKARIKFSFKIESAENRQASIFVPATDIERNANDIFNIIRGMAIKIQDF